MIEERGNLWTYPADARVITTNGDICRDGACVMGRGCAAEAVEKFPGINFVLGNLIKAHGNHVYLLPLKVISFPVKHHWHEQADVELIRRSCIELLELCDAYTWNTIVMPRPGCGNGKLNWDTDVKYILSSYLDDRFVVITF